MSGDGIIQFVKLILSKLHNILSNQLAELVSGYAQKREA